MQRQKCIFHFGKAYKYHAWSCHNVCDVLTSLLDNIFIRFVTTLYKQVVEIPMGTNCAPLVVDLFLFCYERDFMMSFPDDEQDDIILAFNDRQTDRQTRQTDITLFSFLSLGFCPF